MWAKVGRILKNGGAFVLLAAVTLTVLLRNVPPRELAAALRQMRPLPLIGAGAAMAVFMACEICNLRCCLRLSGVECSLRAALRYEAVGYFFSGITPSASGGQPMQLLALRRNGHDPACAALALLLQLAAYQCAELFYGGLGGIYLLPQAGRAMKTAWLLGLGWNTALLALILAAMWGGKLPALCLRAAVRLAKLFSKHGAETLRERGEGAFLSYRAAAAQLRGRRGAFLRLLAVSLVQLLALHSVVFFVYRSCGLSELPFRELILRQGALYLSVCSLPLPGAAGASEGGFLLLFRDAFPSELLPGAMLLSRCCSCYAPLLLTGLGLMIAALRRKKGHD